MLKGNTEICVEKNNYTLLLNFLGLYTAITIFRSKKVVESHPRHLTRAGPGKRSNQAPNELKLVRKFLRGVEGGGCNSKLKRALAENTSQLLC